MRRCLFFVVFLAGVDGCTYDFTLGPRGDGGATDATIDVSADTTIDAASDSSTDSSTDTAVVDTGGPPTDTTPAIDTTPPADTAPDCPTLESNVEKARVKAKKCVSSPSACTTTVTDECGCPSTVGDGSADALAYQNAAKALRDSSCSRPFPHCGTSCGAVKSGFCLVDDAGTGTTCVGP